MALIGNSAYGIQLNRKLKLENTIFFEEMRGDQKLKSQKSRGCDVFDEKNYEIHMARKAIVHDKPNIEGFLVLNNSKRRTLELHYHLMGVIMRPKTPSHRYENRLLL